MKISHTKKKKSDQAVCTKKKEREKEITHISSNRLAQIAQMLNGGLPIY